MKLTLSCPNAEYRANMIIFCKKQDAPCGHVFFKTCKGWWALSSTADNCPLRKETKNNDQR